MSSQTTIQKLVLGPNMSTATAKDTSKDKDYGSETSSTHTEENEKKPVMTETVSVQESGECSRPITTEQILAQRRREKIKANGGVEPEPKPKGAARKLVHSMMHGIAAGNPWVQP